MTNGLSETRKSKKGKIFLLSLTFVIYFPFLIFLQLCLFIEKRYSPAVSWLYYCVTYIYA